MIKTHVEWNRQLTDQELISINSRVDQMKDQGKTDGGYTWIEHTETRKIVERTWSDIAAAEEWIVFIETLSPVSVQIIN